MNDLQKQIDELRDTQIYLLATVMVLCRIVTERELCTADELQSHIAALLDEAKRQVDRRIVENN